MLNGTQIGILTVLGIVLLLWMYRDKIGGLLSKRPAGANSVPDGVSPVVGEVRELKAEKAALLQKVQKIDAALAAIAAEASGAAA